MAAGGKPDRFRFLKPLGLLLVAEAGVAILAAFAIAWFGLYDVAASRGHDPLTAWFLHYVMERSVAAHATNLQPPDLDDPALVLQGATHFYNSCGRCHGAPDQIASPVARQMTPTPPPLNSAAKTFTPQELFWIVKNGIKMTAMPGWPAPQRDDEVWAMVAFLERLPTIKPGEFAPLAGIAPAASGGSASAPAAAQPGFDMAVCARCHGADGNGRDGAFPRLAGLSAGYIAASLRAFRSGDRPSGFMQVATENLSDAGIEAAAAYYAGLPPKPPAAPSPSGNSAQMGKSLVEQGDPGSGIAPCQSCHLPHAPGAAVPGLAGQPARYLAQQLRLLASGARAPQGGAGGIRSSHRLSEAQIAAVSAYLASLP